MRVTALVDTYLKKDQSKQAFELPDNEKVFVEAGRVYTVDPLEFENDDHTNPLAYGHAKIDISYGAGEWWIFLDHWRYEHEQSVVEVPTVLPEWDTVDWNNFAAPVSKYFTVGEVMNMSKARMPKAIEVKRNIIKIARAVDQVREEWGGPLGVTSFYRPWHINRRIGSRSSNHPRGTAMDIRCLRGNTKGLERMVENDFYNAGRWDGGVGRGASYRGFVHLDLNDEYGKRIWNY
ncbi:MAG: D-Ala-D-Ala carboxypeptidase family metallohydrolase [Cyanobacteria bacterium P01_F01_bin.150]